MQILKSPDNGEEWIFSRDDTEMNTSPNKIKVSKFSGNCIHSELQ